MSSSALSSVTISALTKIREGKVREIFDIDEARLLLVATDRISAFDYVLEPPIPGKGRVLTRISEIWFGLTSHICPNHLISTDPGTVFQSDDKEAAVLRGRSMVVKKAQVFPIECVVRGYITGSAWEEYKVSASVCGLWLKPGLRAAQKLDEPLFTPATKAEQGEHDENISFEEACDRIGRDVTEKLAAISVSLYQFAHDRLADRGILLADTKFEFGIDQDGDIMVIDEMLTPDSSRYWPKNEYRLDTSPVSYDKQFVRDYLKSTDWDRNSAPPGLPPEIVEKTAAKYEEVLKMMEELV